MALRRDGKILAFRMHTDADHGAFFADAQPSKFKIGLMHSAFAAYDVPVAHLTARGVYTNKAPGGVAYRCSFRVTEAMFFQERMMQAAADDLGHGPGRVPPDELRPRRRLPAPHPARLPHRLRPVRQVPGRRPQGHRLRELQARAGGGAQARPAARPRHLHDDRAARRGQQPGVRHPRHQDVRLGRAQGAHERQGDPPHRRQDPGAGARDDVGADRRARARHPGRRRRRRGGRHRHRAVRHGHLRVPVHPGRRGGRRHGRPQDPRQGPQAGRAPARGVRGGRRVGARPVLRAQLARSAA